MEATMPKQQHKHQWLALAIVVVVAVAAGVVTLLVANHVLKTYVAVDASLEAPAPKTTPQNPGFVAETVVSGLRNPWDVVFLPDGQMFFSERRGVVSQLVDGKAQTFATIADVRARGEGGLMGLAVDASFTQNRYLYACFTTASDTRVARFKISQTLEDRQDIVTGMPVNQSGRHSGCRIAAAPDGTLWIGTGDTAQAVNGRTTPQDPKSLGGKVLHVDRNGKSVAGNLPTPFDPRIYSYGHRNVQGIALLPQPKNGIIGYTAEHGSSVDDEVNTLSKGNFGWDPDVAYTEAGIPMTDKTKFPDAIEAVWRSGSPTQAPSGLAVITGGNWQAWNGALAMAMLKDKHLKILTLNDQGAISKEERVLTDQGRLRAVRQAPDGNVYVTTDNGENDRILRLRPQQ